MLERRFTHSRELRKSKPHDFLFSGVFGSYTIISPTRLKQVHQKKINRIKSKRSNPRTQFMTAKAQPRKVAVLCFREERPTRIKVKG